MEFTPDVMMDQSETTIFCHRLSAGVDDEHVPSHQCCAREEKRAVWNAVCVCVCVCVCLDSIGAPTELSFRTEGSGKQKHKHKMSPPSNAFDWRSSFVLKTHLGLQAPNIEYRFFSVGVPGTFVS